MKENVLDMRMYNISKYAEIVEIILISIGVFLVPMIIPQLLSAIFGGTSSIANNSQYVVGTIVNSALIIAGINAKGWKKVISIVTLPSISAIASGLVFKSAAIYTVYMIPAIWIGNFFIIYLYRYLFVNKKANYILSSVAGILIKAGVIFAGFNLLLAINAIPKGSKVAQALSMVMGLNQLITATLGSILAFGILKIVYDKKGNKISE